MNVGVPLNSAASHATQPLPIGENTSQPRDVHVHNSSFKPVESLSSSGRTTIRTNERLADAPAVGSGRSKPAEGRSVAEEPTSSNQQDREARIAQDRERQALLREQREIRQLSARDREVRAHEAAHAAVGGQYAGAPSYEFERGPDGVSYAVGGEVSIDTGRAATPEQTVQKAQVVRRAALAPAEPSSQDRRVAAMATRIESQARSEIVARNAEELQQTNQSEDEETEDEAPNGLSDEVSDASPSSSSPLEIADRPRFSDQAPNSVANQISSLDRTSPVSQILSVADVEANRPGALLSQLV